MRNEPSLQLVSFGNSNGGLFKTPISLPMLGPIHSIQHNQQQQQQQLQQQSAQQNQQSGQQQQGPQQGVQQPLPPPPPQNGQDFTLSTVLHFLQSEWRKYERDRNEWEIERAEMRARVALLEGERRSFENVRLDLMRRIKMLEFALRMERSKQLTQPPTLASKLAVIQKEDAQSHKAESGGSSPRSEDSPLPSEGRGAPNGAATSSSNGKMGTWAGANWQASSASSALNKPPPGRDPKSRARSRDYLKQCLQEVSYLTSPAAMNPLPNRPLLNNVSMPLSIPNVPSFDQIYNGRPRKTIPDNTKDFPLLNGMNITSGPSSAPASSSPNMQNLEPRNPLMSNILPSTTSTQLNQQQSSQSGPFSEGGKSGETEVRSLTAIFRPDDDWKQKLREASEQIKRDDEDKYEEPLADDEESSILGEGDGKVWKAKRTLRNHLDAVRALAFHPTELCLATGGDDCTVKIWRMEAAALASSSARLLTESEPQLTLRGHSAAITRLIHSPTKGLLYSASLDSSIRVWALPAHNHTTYAPYDETRSRGELIGHTDAVWDLALVRDEGTLISCGAEGSVKVWDVSGPSGGGSLRLTWGWNGVEIHDELHDDVDAPGATAVEALKTDLKKVAVAYQNAIVKIFDVETGKEVSKLNSDISYDGTPVTQINRLASHPTMSLLVTAHEDKFIRIFDTTTGQCTHSMPAHLDGATALSIDPAGFSLVSGSHDCSIRFWDLLGTKACVQEITTHREKAREGVLDVEFHPSLPFMASAGADGVVKLYASS